MASQPHERLSKAMNERRLDLRMTWNGVASAAEISPEALRAIRRGDYRPSDLTARRLDEVFRWRPGSTMQVLDGGEPEAFPLQRQADPAATTERLDRLYAKWKEQDPDRLLELLESERPDANTA